MSDNSVRVPSAMGEMLGCVKWFNNKDGYGFITVVSACESNGSDIFVHQSNIYPTSSGYRTLRTGEYVSMNLSTEDRPQAVDVTGVRGGPLMCDTELRLRNETTGRRGQGQGSRRRRGQSSEQGEPEDGWKQV